MRLFLLLLSSLFILNCGGSDSEDKSPAQRWGRSGARSSAKSVETNPVKASSISKEVRAFGTIRSADVITITPQVNNRLTSIYVDLGDTVRRGQPLAKIYDVPFKGQVEGSLAQIKQAEATFKRDSAQYVRQIALFKNQLTSEFDLQTAEATYLNSKSQLDGAIASLAQNQENLDNTLIKAPVSGIITGRFAEEGDLASNGQALFEMANMVDFESRVFLSVQDWKSVEIGQEVVLRASSDVNPSGKGVVARKSPQLDPTTGLGEVVIALTERGPSLFAGVLTENSITIFSKENALTVPRNALVEKVETIINPESNAIDLERTYSVFVSVGDSLVERRPLELGIGQGDRVEVLRGLRAGESIVVTGQSGLSEGDKIRVASGNRFASSSKSKVANTEAVPAENSQARKQAFNSLTEEERTKVKSMTQEERRAFFAQKQAQASTDSTKGMR